MKIVDKIKQMKWFREQKNIAIRAEFNNTRPLKNDLGEISHIYEVFNQIATPNNKDNIKIFILIVFFMYSPVSLLNRRICRGGVRREIGKVLGISNSSITKHFADAKSLMLNHKGFREETQRVFDLLIVLT